MNQEKLIQQAIEIREKAYAPYSKFKVGAALLTSTGKVYKGCNIENAAYSVSCCAERVAIFQAIAAGERKFIQMAVVGNTEKPISPCGSCRQVMSEFFDPNMEIHLANLKKEQKTVIMKDLLPFSFDSSDLT